MESESSLKEHLRQLEEKLLKPEIRTSQKELNSLLAVNFFEFGSSGKVLYKDEGIGEEGIGEVKMTLSDFEIHPLSEEIVLTTYRIFNEVKNNIHCEVQFGNLEMGDGKCFFNKVQKQLLRFSVIMN